MQRRGSLRGRVSISFECLAPLISNQAAIWFFLSRNKRSDQDETQSRQLTNTTVALATRADPRLSLKKSLVLPFLADLLVFSSFCCSSEGRECESFTERKKKKKKKRSEVTEKNR